MKFKLVENLENTDLQGAVIGALYSMLSGQFYVTNPVGGKAIITIHNMDCTKNYEFVISGNSLELRLNGKTLKKRKAATEQTAK